jgi:aspartate aminotransferase-like enzyme
MSRAKLFTPGPTAVPPEVLETQARQLIHHRTDDFRSAHREIIEILRYVLNTDNPLVVLSSSGTGAMEASLVNLTQPGDRILVTVNGKFSERWVQLAGAYGVETHTVESNWGDPVTPEEVEKAFEEHTGIDVMFTTHSETSTGVLQDVGAFAGIARDHGALIVVDGISSICAHDIFADRWGLDVVIGGAQKGTMTPPGLSFLSLSSRAIEKIESGRHSCYYFDLLKAVESAKNGDTPYTPAISLVFALQRALQMIREEGIKHVVARHAANAAAVRSAVRALGLDLFSSSPSNATTVVRPPDGTAADIVNVMERKHNVKVAGGQGRLKGRIFRLGHLGHYFPEDMNTMIAALEGTLVELGIINNTGAGLEALRRSYEAAEA